MSRMVKDLYVILCTHSLSRAAGESRFNDFVPSRASPGSRLHVVGANANVQGEEAYVEQTPIDRSTRLNIGVKEGRADRVQRPGRSLPSRNSGRYSPLPLYSGLTSVSFAGAVAARVGVGADACGCGPRRNASHRS